MSRATRHPGAELAEIDPRIQAKVREILIRRGIYNPDGSLKTRRPSLWDRLRRLLFR